MTDRQTDGWTDGQNYDSQDRASIARAVKTDGSNWTIIVTGQQRPDYPFPPRHLRQLRTAVMQMIYGKCDNVKLETMHNTSAHEEGQTVNKAGRISDITPRVLWALLHSSGTLFNDQRSSRYINTQQLLVNFDTSLIMAQLARTE